MGETIARQITLRLPEPLHRRVKLLARRRRMSINRLVQETLEATVREASGAELRTAYDALGTDKEETDVELFLPMQSEVLNGE